MKKFGLFITISLLCAFVGCDSDDVDEAAVPTVAKPVIAVNENTPTSFGVEWDAVEHAFGYQYAVVESDAQGNTSEFRPETQTGATSLRFDGAKAGMRYTVKVKALAMPDSEWADSEYAEIFVELLGEGLSTQTFSFTVKSTDYDSATVEVVPSIDGEKYYFAVLKSSSLVNKNSNAIIGMVKDQIDASSLVQGRQTLRGEWLDPETSYTAVAFGYDYERGASTSLLSRSEPFTTAEDPRMSIELSIVETGDETIAARSIPSDSRSQYFVTAVPAASVEGLSDRDVLSAVLSDLNKLVAANGWNTVAQTLRTGTTTYNVSNLSIGTEYYVVAFGVQQSAGGEAEETTRLFKAKTKTTSPVAQVSVTARIIDGSMLVEPQIGKAAVGFQFKPNAATAHYGYGVFNSNILTLDEDDIAAYLTGDPADMDPEDDFVGYYVMDWGYELYVATVGVNAIGELGPLMLTKIVVSEDDVWDGTTDFERGDASVAVTVSLLDGGKLSSQYSGYPAQILEFAPDAKCVDYRWMSFLKVGVVDQFGENALLEILMDEDYHDDGTGSQNVSWYDRSDTYQDMWATVFNPTILGNSYDEVGVALDAEGLPGKMFWHTINWPSSMAGLSSVTAPARVPTSTMLHAHPTKLHREIELCKPASVRKTYSLR